MRLKSLVVTLGFINQGAPVKMGTLTVNRQDAQALEQLLGIKPMSNINYSKPADIQ